VFGQLPTAPIWMLGRDFSDGLVLRFGDLLLSRLIVR
jgi:hypothetical protein